MQGEFIDYVFSDASGGAKMVLADGFGLDAFLGFAGQEEERHYHADEADEDDMGKMKGPPPMDRPEILIRLYGLSRTYPSHSSQIETFPGGGCSGLRRRASQRLPKTLTEIPRQGWSAICMGSMGPLGSDTNIIFIYIYV